MGPVETTEALGLTLRELGSWGFAALFAGILIWVMRAYINLQSKVTDLISAVVASTTKMTDTLESLEQHVKSNTDMAGDVRETLNLVKSCRSLLDRMHERVLLCSRKD